MKKILTICVGVIVGLLVFVGFRFQNNSPTSLGSINDGQAYNSTTTDATWNSSPVTCWRLLKTGYGVLGSVVITTSSATKIAIYDATTTATGASYGTTTLAQFAASAAANTYTFDVSFSKGLVVDFASAGQVCSSVASTTITWR